MHEFLNYLTVMDETAFNIVMLLLIVAAITIWRATSFLTALIYCAAVSFFALFAIFLADGRQVRLLDEIYPNVALTATAGLVAGLAVMVALHATLNTVVDALEIRRSDRRSDKKRTARRSV